MAFDWKGLKRISHMGSIGVGDGSVKSFWTYVTNDDAAAVETSGYFNTAVNEMRKGDILLASLDVDGTPKVRTYGVSANDGSAVTITQGEAQDIA